MLNLAAHWGYDILDIIEMLRIYSWAQSKSKIQILSITSDLNHNFEKQCTNL